MPRIKDLIASISKNTTSIQADLKNGSYENLSQYLDNADEYLLAPDLSKSLVNNFNAGEKQTFMLYIVMNERFHFEPSSKIFLRNVHLYLPKDSNIYRRITLFSALSKMNHVQNQYKQLVLSFVAEAAHVYELEDPYLNHSAIKQLLLGYFSTFIQTSKEYLAHLGQLGLLEEMLPDFVQALTANKFGRESLGEMLSIIKGTFDHQNITVDFITNTFNEKISN